MDDHQKILDLVDQILEVELTEESLEWMHKICTPEFGIIDNLIIVLNEECENTETANRILRAFGRCVDYMPELITPQVQQNKDFAAVIYEYIKHTSRANIEGEAFILLGKYYDEQAFQGYSEDDDFVKMIFDAFAYIKSSVVFKSLCMILVRMSYYIDEPTDNLIFGFIETHPNQVFFGEVLLHILNTETDIQNLKMLLTLIRDYNGYAEYFQFSTNDTQILIDIVLRL